MATVHVQPDCGNAPRILLLRDFMIAFANNDIPFVLDWLVDGIQWEWVGGRSRSGKTEVESMLKDMVGANAVDEVSIATIITHGDAGSVNGTIRFVTGRTFGFCNVYTFTGHSKAARIKHITSYLIRTE